MSTPSIDDLKMANGLIQPATPEDLERDAEGITKPNLHRRLDEDIVELQPEQVAKDTHTVYVGGSNSYRGTEHYYYTSTDIEQDVEVNYVGDGSQKAFNLRPFVTEVTVVTINGVTQASAKYDLDRTASQLVFHKAPAKNRLVVISYRIISETP